MSMMPGLNPASKRGTSIVAVRLVAAIWTPAPPSYEPRSHGVYKASSVRSTEVHRQICEVGSTFRKSQA
eukprot:3644594-Amphidinium_carterae.1